jgi:hypothetical protein
MKKHVMHTRRFSRMLLVALLTLLASISTLLTASPAMAAETINQQARGTFIYATFEFPDPSTCTTVYGAIYGNFDVSVQTGDSAQVGSTVEATYIVYDNCSNTYLHIASGAVQLPGSSGFHLRPSLTSATVNATFTLTDSVTGESFPVSVDVTLTGVGSTTAQMIIDHAVGPDYVINGRYIGRFRSASPSGTITYGTTTYNLGQASYVFSYLGVANSGFISITHP